MDINAPFSKSHEKILFRPYEFSIWTGINGHGKSQFVGQIILDMMNQGARVCLASLEMRPEIFLSISKASCSNRAPLATSILKSFTDWFTGNYGISMCLCKMKLMRLIEIFTYAASQIPELMCS